MTVATYVPPGGMFTNHNGGYSVNRDGKTIAHIRPVGNGKWKVFRLDRNGSSGSYDSPEKAAWYYGLKIDEWVKN